MASLSMSTSSNIIRPPEQDDQGRLRVSKACTRCRTRKDRCDGLKPSCTACVHADKQCIYEPTTKKRGLPEGYVRGLEKLLTLASHSIGGLEDVLVSYLQNEEVKKSWNTPVGDELYTTWKESKLYQELEVFLGNSSGMKRKRTSDDEDGSDSPGDRLDTIVQLLRDQGHCLSVTSNADDPETDGLQSTPAHRAGAQDFKALPANSKELLDSYFAYVHCWFPVLDRPSVLKAYYSHLKQTPISHPGKRLDGNQALLWAIFAYATVIDSSGPDRKEQSRRYSEISINYIPAPSTNDEDVQDFDATHGQALLILALLRLGNGQWLGCWNCTGRAVRILLALRNEHHNTQPNFFRGALQGAFMIETLLNVHFCNPRSLFPISLIDVMIDEDGYEEWGTWSPPRGSMSTSNEPSFTLSLFNRLTKVFLILHEALTNVDANSDSHFIQSKLENIHTLAQEHFRSGIGSPSLQSPPHHVYFQIGLLFAQLRLVSCVSETARHQFDLTSLAINVLGLFEICSKADHIGLSRIPPLYADILVLASDVAAQARHAFGGSPSSPSYSNFTSTITEFRSRLSNVWDSFRRPEPQTVDVEYDLDLTSVPEVPLSASTLTNSSIPDPWPTQQQFPPQSTTYAQIGRSNFGRNSFGQSSQVFGMAYPVTSPSFSQGDEVDAIFHEMAHLDTNEWTNERALGLKDFGFTDESAFMDFCNDPERLGLAVENAAAAPLSSSRQSWTFATHPS